MTPFLSTTLTPTTRAQPSGLLFALCYTVVPLYVEKCFERRRQASTVGEGHGQGDGESINDDPEVAGLYSGGRDGSAGGDGAGDGGADSAAVSLKSPLIGDG